MTPEEYEHAEKRLSRYGHRFDLDVDAYLPPRTAQCSFRALKISGNINQLQQQVRSRDRSKDNKVKAEQDLILQSIRRHDEALARKVAECWWQEPARTLDEKVLTDVYRALKECLEESDALENTCYAFHRSMPGLRKAALSLGLTHEKIYAKVGADGGRLYLGDVIGQAAAIRKKAAELQAVAEDEERQEKAQRVAEPKAKDDRAKSQRRAFLAEAMQMSDWDPTGTWSIQCEKLSKYDETAPQKLTMQIWRDDFRFDELHEDPDDSTNESEEDDGEDEAGKELEEDSHDPFDDEKIENYPWGKRSRSRKRPEEGAHLPRFHAKFHFAVVEGDMRILPARAQEAIVSEALLD